MKVGIIIWKLQSIRMIEYHFLYAREFNSNIKYFGDKLYWLWNWLNPNDIPSQYCTFLKNHEFLGDLRNKFVISFAYLQLIILAVSLIWWRCATVVLIWMEIFNQLFFHGHFYSSDILISTELFSILKSAIIVWFLIITLNERRSLPMHITGISSKPLVSFVVDKNKSRFGFIKKEEQKVKIDKSKEEHKNKKKDKAQKKADKGHKN